MKRKLAAVILLVFVIGAVFTACNSKNKDLDVSGSYACMTGHILLNKDGTFELNNKIVFTGKYTVNGKEIEFNVEKMNNQEVGSVVYGTIENGIITGPDGIEYKKGK